MDAKKLRIAILSLLAWFLDSKQEIQASPLKMSYSGRFVDQSGVPVQGPVDIRIRFYNSQTEGSQLSGDKVFEQVMLQEGIFQVVISFISHELSFIFADN